jgi:hypothetical protein
MIPVDSKQTIVADGQAKSLGQGVTTTAKNIPFLVIALTDRIYKDKPGAIVREYSTNASDAHILAKLSAKEIIVTLPSLKDPTLRIRDFGAGLTEDEISNRYCILGESDKRENNDLNGQLGLGCKSGFAYGDSFIVTAWINGKKTVYNIIKGDLEKEGQLLRMAENDMAEGDRTGIEVSIPIKAEDISTIHTKAVDFFKYWEVLPVINNLTSEEQERLAKWRNETPFLSGQGWQIRPNSSDYGNGKGVALMGQVAYPIDWSMLRSKMAITADKRILLEILQSNDIVLSFPIGALKFTINREELEYTETTYKNLEEKIEEIFVALKDAVIKKFADAKSIWEAKRIHLALFGKNIGDKEENGEEEETDAIKVLEGDFYRLEDMFKGSLFWNGIEINSPHFSKMQMWDVDSPDQLLCDTNDPSTPCLISYSKKKTRVKRLRCTSDEYNRITPYSGVKVIVVDGRMASMTQTVARYFLLPENSKTHKVHILRFANDDQKAAFFKHYHFDTAEFTNLSTIVEDVRAWQKANRKTYSSGGGAVAKLKYIDVESGSIEEADVALRDLEDGGVFVGFSRKRALLPNGKQPRLEHVASHMPILSKYFNEEVDRVYCIPEGKLEAKWFQKAKDEGLWVNLSSFLQENVEVVVSDDMKKKFHYDKYVTGSKHGMVNEVWMNAIIEKLAGGNPEFNALSQEMVSDPEDVSDLNNALEFFDLPAVSFGRAPVDYNGLMLDIKNKYPLLEHLAIGSYSYLDKKKLTAIVDYIETVDAAKNVLTNS